MKRPFDKLSAMAHLKRLSPAVIVVLAAVSAVWAQERETEQPPVLVELFTSQGCSSCPPADRLLRELGRRPGIVAISWPINYWDYLGWADTFAKPRFTERQKAYQKVLDRHYVYTPQMVIDGRRDVVGSKKSEVQAALKAARAAGGGVPVTLRHDGRRLVVSLGAGAPGNGADGAKARPPATVWLVHLRRHAEVTIERGENAGRHLEYGHVARGLRKIGEWQGAAKTVTIPDSELWVEGSDGCAVIVQESPVGPVLGAAQFFAGSAAKPAASASGG